MPFVFFFCLVLFMFVRLSEVVDQINLKKNEKKKTRNSRLKNRSGDSTDFDFEKRAVSYV